MQGVEGVEELFLRGFLSGDELDIVDQQHVGGAILLAERLCGVRADGGDQVVGEFFRGNV